LYSGYATKLEEHKTGIDKIYRGKIKCSSSLSKYENIISLFNHKDSKTRIYPGSPLFALAVMRENDSAYFYELHSSDFNLLKDNCSSSKVPVKILQEDGLQGLQSLLRADTFKGYNKVVLIDPSYELRAEFKVLSRSIWNVNEHFENTCCAIWCKFQNHRFIFTLLSILADVLVTDPMLTTKSGFSGMLQDLKTIPNLSNWVDAGMFLSDSANKRGMYGSGVFTINPPETVSNNMDNLLDTLTQNLKEKNKTHYDYKLEFSRK